MRLSILTSLAVCAASAAAQSGSIPVFYINTDGGAPITSKEDYISASYWLDPKGDASVEAIGSQEAPLTMKIRGRGNYTWTGFDKKPYRLKLDKKAALCGLPKSKHWALLAHADDSQGFLRNTVGFQLSRMAGLPWTPGDVPVEVVLNGDYIGLYFLTETVRVDSDRVDVADYDSEYEDYAEANPGQTLPWQDDFATGGWLVEIDNYDDKDQIKITSSDPYNYEANGQMRITYDTPSDYITTAHLDWLRSDFETMDEMVVSGDRGKCEWADKIDLTDLARFFLVNQLTFNYESFHGSCKMWRERGVDEKWHYGPVWDFGSAFIEGDNARYFFKYGPYSNHWIRTMYEYPLFREEVKRVYRELRDNDFDAIYSYIDTFVAHIAEAAAADRERWRNKGYGNEDPAANAVTVKEMLSNAVKFLDSELGAPTHGDEYDNIVYFEDDGGDTPWDQLYVFTWNPVLHGNWPGQPMESIEYQGRKMWRARFDGDLTEGNICIIFDNGQAGVGVNQTEDLEYRNHAVYNRSGLTGEYIYDDSGIATVTADSYPVEYYTLTGIRIDKPERGTPVIRRQGPKAKLVINY